jgi:hypothetical protein
VKGKSERVLRLLERGPFLEEERERARKVAREIKGFGSFSLKSGGGSSGSRAQLWGEDGAAPQMYGRSHSQYEQDRRWKEDDVDEDEEEKGSLIAPKPEREAVVMELEERHHRHPFHGFGQQRPEAMLLLSQ